MVRYLTISLFINLVLFLAYSYWVGKALENAFREVKQFLPPLVVKVEELKPPEVKKEKGEISLSGAETQHTEENEKTAPPKVEKRKSKGSLLEELIPVVKREYETTFKKIVSKAKASLSTEKGKVKLNIDRKVVYVPKIEPIRVEYPPAPVEVKVTVLPDGRVINAVLLKRSGNPKVDRAVLKFVKNLRFAPIGEPIIQEIYITFRFEV